MMRQIKINCFVKRLLSLFLQHKCMVSPHKDIMYVDNIALDDECNLNPITWLRYRTLNSLTVLIFLHTAKMLTSLWLFHKTRVVITVISLLMIVICIVMYEFPQVTHANQLLRATFFITNVSNVGIAKCD